MVTIAIATSDSQIWNVESVIIEVTAAMAKQEDIIISLNNEGPDAEALGLIGILKSCAQAHQYDINKIVILTANVMQTTLPVKHIVTPPTLFLENTKQRMKFVSKAIKYTFGMFIGRSNMHRLYLSSYLWKHYKRETIQTFHYDSDHEFHSSNLGMSELVNYYGAYAGIDAAEFLIHTPLTIQPVKTYPLLMDQHCDLADFYADFFVEIACETYYTGTTFFPTEKTWRAMATGTPFIIQGPECYLHRLRDLGFKTFNNYWDEGYAEDPADYQPYEIVKVIEQLGLLSATELQAMYIDMLPILKHNQQRLQELTMQDFKKLTNDNN